jgi:DNA-binding XRE family transcriptional regulator
MKIAPLTPEACRAGRALLKWGVRDLGDKAGLSQTTVVQFEAGRPHADSTVVAIRAAFTRHGVEITNGNGTGARLLNKKPHKPKA